MVWIHILDCPGFWWHKRWYCVEKHGYQWLIKKNDSGEFLGGLAVKDSALSLLWFGLDSWPRNLYMPWVWPKKKGSEEFKPECDHFMTNWFHLCLKNYAWVIHAKNLMKFGEFLCGAAEKNLSRNHEVVGSIPGLTQGVKDQALPWAVVQVEDAAWIPSCCGCGAGQQLQLWFNP